MDNSCRFIYFSLILMRVRISNALTANGCRLPRHMPVCLEPAQNQECFPNQHTKYHGSRQVSRWKPTFNKIQPKANPPEADQTGLKLQSRCKRLILTTKPALVIQMDIVCVRGRFNMLGCLVPS